MSARDGYSGARPISVAPVIRDADPSQRKGSIVNDGSEQGPPPPPKSHQSGRTTYPAVGGSSISESPSAAEFNVGGNELRGSGRPEAGLQDLKSTDPKTREHTLTEVPRNGPSRKSTLDPESKPGGVEDGAPPIANARFQALQGECEILQACIIELRQHLKDAQDFIFSLQPRQQRLTETEAAADFATLCGSIEGFVGDKLGDALYDKHLIREGRVPSRIVSPAKHLLELIPYPGREAYNRLSDTDEYNVTAAILLFLCEQIFSLKFYCPLPDTEREFIESIEKSMRNLKPHRDIRTRRTWHAETYTAITSRHGFDRLRENRKLELTRDLTDMLRILAPTTSSRNIMNGIQKDIIEPAFALAHKLSLSLDLFTIEWSPYHDLKPDQRGPLLFSDYEVVDLATTKTLKSQPQGLAYVFDITPALVFREVKADTVDKPKVLKKQKILSTVNKDGRREPERRPGVDATVLGWLEEQILIADTKHSRFGPR